MSSGPAATVHLEFSEKEPAEWPEGYKLKIRRDLARLYAGRGHLRAVFEIAHALPRESKGFENPLALDQLYVLVVVIRLRIQWVSA